jgi:hypothetical protein
VGTGRFWDGFTWYGADWDYYFPCFITVMDDPAQVLDEIPFLFGLGMMKRHTCPDW